MTLVTRYLTIPLLFSMLVTSYAITAAQHNQAEYFGLLLYGVLFYGAPYYLLALLVVAAKASATTVHAGFIGVTLALFTIASLWLLPPDPSGLPIQWMGYWPLAAIIGVIFMGASIAFRKYKHS